MADQETSRHFEVVDAVMKALENVQADVNEAFPVLCDIFLGLAEVRGFSLERIQASFAEFARSWIAAMKDERPRRTVEYLLELEAKPFVGQVRYHTELPPEQRQAVDAVIQALINKPRRFVVQTLVAVLVDVALGAGDVEGEGVYKIFTASLDAVKRYHAMVQGKQGPVS